MVIVLMIMENQETYPCRMTEGSHAITCAAAAALRPRNSEERGGEDGRKEGWTEGRTEGSMPDKKLA